MELFENDFNRRKNKNLFLFCVKVLGGMTIVMYLTSTLMQITNSSTKWVLCFFLIFSLNFKYYEKN